ncbi:MAG: glutamate 5-kinase [Firmicutes bacterium]|nr:glutamate 5-kinase [Bacillota bacterium]
MFPFENAKRIVLKIGSSTLTHESGLLNIRRVEELVKVIADISNSGKEIVIVSSGAVAVGVGKLGMKQKPKDIAGKQATAAVGQCELMYIYDKQFQSYGKTVAQILLTRDVVENSTRHENAVNTFSRLLEMNCIPIVNENDTVSLEELEFGDNDTLSAIVAGLIQADALILLSDIDGLYDKDPHQNPDAKLIPIVNKIDEHILSLAGGAGSNRGTGGMNTKLSAAQEAFRHNIPMAIINGQKPANLYDIFDGKQCGTFFIKEE